MRLLSIFLFAICLSFSGFAQEERIFFSEALSSHLPRYQDKADKAYMLRDYDRAEFLFDSLVQFCLKGSVLDNFKVHNLKKKEVHLEDFQKPVFLRTYASWLVPNSGEIPALNQLAQEYEEEIQIVVLYWDTRERVKNLEKKFDDRITILYVDELQNRSPEIIRTMKHSLGFPTTFLLDREKRILDIKRSISHPYGLATEKSFELNYASISNEISLLLLEDFKNSELQERVARLP